MMSDPLPEIETFQQQRKRLVRLQEHNSQLVTRLRVSLEAIGGHAMPPSDAIQDLVVVLPGIMGSTLAKNGKPVWSPSAGSVLTAIRTFGEEHPRTHTT